MLKKIAVVMLILTAIFVIFSGNKLKGVILKNGNIVTENGVTGCDCTGGGNSCQCYVIKR